MTHGSIRFHTQIGVEDKALGNEIDEEFVVTFEDLR